VANNILKLPRVSDSFKSHIESHSLQKNEWMPCPRCGSETVTPPSGGLVGGCAGASLIGCWLMWIIFVAVIMAIIFFPVAIVVVIIGLIMIPVLPAIGAAFGMTYQCKSCNFAWLFKDVEQYQDQCE